MLRKMSPAVPLEISRPDALNVMRSRVTVSFGAPGNLFECTSDILRSTASICVAYRPSARDSTLRACGHSTGCPRSLLQLLDAPPNRRSRAGRRAGHAHVDVVRRRRRNHSSARIQADVYPRQLVVRAVPGSVHIREPEYYPLDVRSVRTKRVVDPMVDVRTQRR